MRTRTLHAALAALCVAPALAAWRSSTQPLTLMPTSRLWVDGTSTVRSFSCAAATIDARVETTAPRAVGAVLDGQKVVRSATLTVPAAALDCRNGTMNEHMLKALKAKEFPAITFTVATYDLSTGGGGAQGTATGELQLGGATRPITVTGTVARDADGALHITGSYPLRMTEWGLKPPSLMMGTMKVNPQVKVGFDLRLQG